MAWPDVAAIGKPLTHYLAIEVGPCAGTATEEESASKSPQIALEPALHRYQHPTLGPSENDLR